MIFGQYGIKFFKKPHKSAKPHVFFKKTSKNRTMHRPHRRKSVKIVRFRFRVEKPHTAHSQIANAALTLKRTCFDQKMT